MRVSPLVLRIGVGIAAVGVFALLRYAPWAAKNERAALETGESPADLREALTVGFLPVT